MRGKSDHATAREASCEGVEHACELAFSGKKINFFLLLLHRAFISHGYLTRQQPVSWMDTGKAYKMLKNKRENAYKRFPG
jgi:hypothetical protein